ncbi:endonuclease/exonuclease/phosphatase family protein [Cryptosporidium muris RN66]|uniref:Endonuclease/exonuclease/phosphatase family protein n=1 Tax=Cryptosporidium muris (strain RN66) TaxID=441375 RepID=B6AIH1_CRYMR|nr:endonuclease/exonuclease/phosphatase family protein [Cryptosporidium muris RN66]EEA08012.1 endonuclease/exonuclease/phosphatase family protein [Cryptosporidium muris RN66]|eukprot:XP_002142361.1 endonuclease/exonuclease/phosphatase family protein [Cryptosporidium muris RN66]
MCNDKVNKDGYLLLSQKGDKSILVKLIISLPPEFIKYFNENTGESDQGVHSILSFAMVRQPNEKVTSFLRRLSINFQRHIKTSYNRKAKSIKLPSKCSNFNIIFRIIKPDGEIISDNDKFVCSDLLNPKVSYTLNIEFLDINIQEIFYPILSNIPMIEHAVIKSDIRWGSSIVPSVTLCNGSIEDFIYEWYVKESLNKDKEMLNNNLPSELPKDTIVISTGFICTLSQKILEDLRNKYDLNVRFNLILRITNKLFSNKMLQYIYYCGSILEPIHNIWREKRIKNFIRGFNETNQEDEQIRLVSFNILADIYTQTPKALTEMYISCPQYALQSQYRRSLIIQELIDLDADILCLQEVQSSTFVQFYQPILAYYNYNGCIAERDKEKGGVATFMKKDKFNIINSHCIHFNSRFIENYPDLVEKISIMWPQFFTNLFYNISTVYQFTIAESIYGSMYLVINTHLFYHPNGGHVRILQIKLLMDLVKEYLEIIKQNYPGKVVYVLLFGDFNSLPNSGSRRLLLDGHISCLHLDWNDAMLYNNGENNISSSKIYNLESSFGIDIEVPYTCIDLFNLNTYKTDCVKMKHTIGTSNTYCKIKEDQDPCLIYPFTHLVSGFSGQLDYIYLIKSKDIEGTMIEINRYLSPVIEDDLQPYKMLPNPEYASDHISVGIELTFQTKK